MLFTYVVKSPAELAEEALCHLINSPSLKHLGNVIWLHYSDHTRPMPSKVTLPILLRRIRTVN
ncbi:MAG: lactate racemase domain-containing protein [Veillonella sp.]